MASTVPLQEPDKAIKLVHELKTNKFLPKYNVRPKLVSHSEV